MQVEKTGVPKMDNPPPPPPKMNIPQMFENTFREFLSQAYYPMDQVSKPWQKYALKALSNASPASLGISGEVFLQMFHRISRKERLTMMDFASMANNLEASTANQLGIKLSTFAALMDETHRYVTVWNQLTEGIRQQAKDKITELAAEEKRKHEEQQAKPALKNLKCEATLS